MRNRPECAQVVFLRAGVKLTRTRRTLRSGHGKLAQLSAGCGGNRVLTAGLADDTCRKVMSDTYTIAQAQASLPQLCRSNKRFVIARRDKPVYVALPIGDFDAILETMELLADPKAMKALRAARAGKVKYRELDLADANFGLRLNACMKSL
jgi:PHD/YefM family antitoxin component YafN of YafNO toxin-antitoxin module